MEPESSSSCYWKRVVLEEVDELQKKKKVSEKKPRGMSADHEEVKRLRARTVPWGLIIFSGLLSLAFFGGGFGAGWAARRGKDPAPRLQSDGGTNEFDYALTNINLVRPFKAISVMNTHSDEQTEELYEQQATMQPALALLTTLLSAIGNETAVFDPNVLHIHLSNKYGTDSAIMAQLYNVGQRLQGVPGFQSVLADLQAGLSDFLQYLRENAQSVSVGRHHHHRRLLQADNDVPLLDQLLYGLLSKAVQQGALSGASKQLAFLEPRLLLELAVDTYNTLRGLVADLHAIRATQDVYNNQALAGRTAVEVRVVDASTNASTPWRILPIPLNLNRGDEGVDVDVNSIGGGGETPSAAGARRALLQSGSALPAGFVPAAASTKPAVRLPVCFHVMLYRTGSTFGPPDFDKSADMVARLIEGANTRLKPSNFQVFLHTEADGSPCVRANPSKHPYLVMDSREAWLACAQGNFGYDCGEALGMNTIAVDFPRVMQVFVNGELPRSAYVGYAFPPGPDGQGNTYRNDEDVVTGHIGLLWSVLSFKSLNTRSFYDAGAQTFVHEIAHHIGLFHPFTEEGMPPCSDTDGISDTVVTSGPAYSMPYASKAQQACMKLFRDKYKSDWAAVDAALAARLGAAEDQLVGSVTRSCPSRACPPGMATCVDEVGNYLTYSSDACFATVGHLTPGQVTKMHEMGQKWNEKLYNWGQYYASIYKPPVATPAPTPAPTNAPVATPAPAVAAAASAKCGVKTQQGCQCKVSWEYNGVTYRGCSGSVPGVSATPLCAVERDGSCASPRNGWWDACTPPANPSGCKTVASSVSAPTPAPATTTATTLVRGGSGCQGSGVVSKGGYACSNSWRFTPAGAGATTTTHAGCANPNADPKGAWCRLSGTQSSDGFSGAPKGANWDYCADACVPVVAAGGSDSSSNATAVATAVFPRSLGCSTTAKGLPKGCKCKATWGATIPNIGTFNGMMGCTSFKELNDPAKGLCMLEGCKSASDNGQGSYCTCGTSK